MDKKLGVKTGTHEELIQSGDMELYFDNRGILFDKADGLFKIDLKKKEELRFKSDNI